jgi:hypothetical protein
VKPQINHHQASQDEILQPAGELQILEDILCDQSATIADDRCLSLGFVIARRMRGPITGPDGDTHPLWQHAWSGQG